MKLDHIGGASLEFPSPQLYTDQMHYKVFKAFKSSNALVKPMFMLLAGSLLSLSAWAQWQWVDKDGRKVFSDRSPPADIAEKDILKRPGRSTKAAGAPAATDLAATVMAKSASAPASAASAPKLSGKDTELEARRKKTEDEEAAKKVADDEKTAKIKVENCSRAKTSLATLDSGIRMAAVNAKGEREVYDDAKRDSETKRAQDAIISNCK